MSKTLYPIKNLIENFEVQQDDNALIGFYNQKFIILNFVSNELCYQPASNDNDKKLFNQGDFMIGELTPITQLQEKEQQEIRKLFTKDKLEYFTTLYAGRGLTEEEIKEVFTSDN